MSQGKHQGLALPSSPVWVWNCFRKVVLVQLQGRDHTGDRRVTCVELLWNFLEYRISGRVCSFPTSGLPEVTLQLSLLFFFSQHGKYTRRKSIMVPSPNYRAQALLTHPGLGLCSLALSVTRKGSGALPISLCQKPSPYQEEQKCS